MQGTSHTPALDAPSNPTRGVWVELALVLAVAIGIFWPYLGNSGFAFSEGQRVFPGWEMLHNHDWLLPRLMDQPYLRKPPGMPWAIAAFGYFLGEDEFSARAISALSSTLSALVCFVFANRWFGRPYGLLAGIAFSLAPLFWYPGRSAEIEAIHDFLTLAACCATLDLLVRQSRPGAGSLASTLLLTVSTTGMILVKGPAGLPCLGGALIGACIANRSMRPILNPFLWVAFSIAAATTGYIGWLVVDHSRTFTGSPVLQSAEAFLWIKGRIFHVLFLPFESLAAGFPLVLALPLAMAPIRNPDQRARIGLAVSWTLITSLLIYTAAGVSNNRYTMPAATLMPLMFAFASYRLATGEAPLWARRFSRLVQLHRPRPWAYLLMLTAIASIVWGEDRREYRTSGRLAGITLANELVALTPDATLELWGDALIDNRPEVVYYAQQRAARLGRELHPHWNPANHNGSGECPLPPPGGILLLVESGGGLKNEVAKYKASGVLDSLEEIAPGSVHIVHKFIFRVYRVPVRHDRYVGPPDNGAPQTPQIVMDLNRGSERHLFVSALQMCLKTRHGFVS